MECNIDDDKVKVIMLLVTNSCNLNCVYCYENHKKQNKMTIEVAKQSILSEIHDEKFDRYSIQFMGGEPLLSFSLIKELSEWIWESNIIEKPYELFGSTNGTCLTKEMKDWFYANRHRISFGLSIDGTPEVQNKNRSNSARLIDFDFFLKTWPNLYFKMTISTYSIAHVYDSIVYLEEKGVKNIKADLAYMDGWNNEHLVIWEEQLDRLCEYYRTHECHCSLFDHHLEAIFAKDIRPKRCGCGEDIVCIDYDGEKYPCQMFSPISMETSVYEKVKDIDFSNMTYFSVKECQGCILRALCPSCCGCNLKYNGSLNKVSAFYCKAFITNFLKTLKYRFIKAQEIEDIDLKNDTLNDLQEISRLLTIK